jgi:hypothetical protein
MKLPNGKRAEIGSKLRDYVLSMEHPRGRHKAVLFESILGITVEEENILETAIRNAAIASTDCIDKGDNGFGRAYALAFELKTPRASAMVMTAWIVLHEEDFPRLTTCYIL